MWVRRQNKKFLGNYDSFAVSESGIVLGYQGPEDAEGAVLGAYENEEIALSVLNELQGYIGVTYQGIKSAGGLVFEMPLEVKETEWLTITIPTGVALNDWTVNTVLIGNILDFSCVGYDDAGNDIYKVEVSKEVAEQWRQDAN